MAAVIGAGYRMAFGAVVVRSTGGGGIWDTSGTAPSRDTIYVAFANGLDTLIGFRKVGTSDTTELFNKNNALSVFKLPYGLFVASHIKTPTLRVGILLTEPDTDTMIQVGSVSSKARLMLGSSTDPDSAASSLGYVKRTIPAYDTGLATIDIPDATIQAGANITISASGSTVTIAGPAGSGTADSIGVDTDGNGTTDNYLYSTAAAIATIKKGANITFSVTGDELTISGPAGGGTSDSVGIDTNGDGTADNYLYSTVAEAFRIRKGDGVTLTVSFDTVTFAASLGTSIETGEIATDAVNDLKIDFGTGANQVSTDDVTEGATNKYNPFGTTVGGSDLAADGVNDLAIDFGTGANQVSTDDVPEGSSNKYNPFGTAIDSGEIASPALNSTNWNTAYAWGNHASAGYATKANIHDSLIADTAVFLASLTRLGKLTDDTANWNSAFSWGNHASQNYWNGLVDIMPFLDHNYFDSSTALVTDSLIVIFSDSALGAQRATTDRIGNVINTFYSATTHNHSGTYVPITIIDTLKNKDTIEFKGASDTILEVEHYHNATPSLCTTKVDVDNGTLMLGRTGTTVVMPNVVPGMIKPGYIEFGTDAVKWTVTGPSANGMLWRYALTGDSAYWWTLAVDSNDVVAGGFSLSDLNQSGATNGQVIKWSTSSGRWIPGTDETAGGSADTSKYLAYTRGGVRYAWWSLDSVFNITDNLQTFTITFDSANSKVRLGAPGIAEIPSMKPGQMYFGTGDSVKWTVTGPTADGMLWRYALTGDSAYWWTLVVTTNEIGAAAIKDADIDFGTGANQVSTDDVTEGSTNKYNPFGAGIGLSEMEANSVDSTKIDADKLAESDMDWKYEWVPLTVVHGRSPVTDSVTVTLPKAPNILFRDSTNQGSDMDTVTVSGFTPYTTTFSIDSIAFVYQIVTATTVIDSIEFWGPDITNALQMADSSYYNVDVALSATSLTRVAYYVNETNVTPGQYSIRFVNDLTPDNGVVVVAWAAMRIKR